MRGQALLVSRHCSLWAVHSSGAANVSQDWRTAYLFRAPLSLLFLCFFETLFKVIYNSVKMVRAQRNGHISYIYRMTSEALQTFRCFNTANKYSVMIFVKQGKRIVERRRERISVFLHLSGALHLLFIGMNIKACLMGLQAHVEKCPSFPPPRAGGDQGGAHKVEQIMFRIPWVPSAP